MLDESVVDDAVSLGVLESHIKETRALTGGRGGRTWRIDTADDRLVLHRRSGRGRLTGVGVEALATAAAASVGVGPEVVGLDDAAGLLLTRWIPGRAATAPGLATTHLGDAALTLRRLHAIAPPPGPADAHHPVLVEPLTARAAYLDRASDLPQAPSWSRAALTTSDDFQHMVDALGRITRSREPVLIHGDPVPGNLIVSADSVHLVDFEYAGAGDPWYEVGHLAASVHLDASAVVALVGEYSRGEGERPPLHDDETAVELSAIEVEAWSYVAAQAWIAWVVLGEDDGARSQRWHRWALRAVARLERADRSGRTSRLAAQLLG